MNDLPPLPPKPWALPFPFEATDMDIYHCFRLLLGRNPMPEEWRGHTNMAGQALKGVVSGYLNSLEFSLGELRETRSPEEILLAELPEFKIYCDMSDPAVGQHIPAGYDRDVAAVFRSVLRPGMGVIDIGANMGFFTMLAASLVGEEGFVLAVEPNSRNASLLECSRRENGFSHVQVAQVAAGSETGMLSLHTSRSTGTTSGLPGALASVLAAQTVPALALDCLVPPGRTIDFIKIDVDGSEYKALLGCGRTIARDRPLILSEFAPGIMPGISGVDGETYLRWLGGFGYEVSVIEPDGSLRPMQQRWADVLAAYRNCGSDHIDILAVPRRPEAGLSHGGGPEAPGGG